MFTYTDTDILTDYKIVTNTNTIILILVSGIPEPLFRYQYFTDYTDITDYSDQNQF